MSDNYPTVDESRDRLRRAGWSLGETCSGDTWQVDGTNGENRFVARGSSQAEAWWAACVMAREVGMLAPPDDVRSAMAREMERSSRSV